MTDLRRLGVLTVIPCVTRADGILLMVRHQLIYSFRASKKRIKYAVRSCLSDKKKENLCNVLDSQ